MTYEIKPLFCDPSRIKGMSERLIVSHYETNYGSAVKRLNLIDEQLAALDFALKHIADPTDPTGRFVAVELAPLRPLRRPVALARMRADHNTMLPRQAGSSVRPSACAFAVTRASVAWACFALADTRLVRDGLRLRLARLACGLRLVFCFMPSVPARTLQRNGRRPAAGRSCAASAS